MHEEDVKKEAGLGPEKQNSKFPPTQPPFFLSFPLDEAHVLSRPHLNATTH